jgi:hypothetical protein
MRIHSQPGRGTMVVLRLPKDRAAAHKAELAEAAA